MMFPGNGCCCGDPPCRVFQVNAIKAHGGMPGNEPPWIGVWESFVGSNAGTIQYVEDRVLYIISDFAWPAYRPRPACSTVRFLRYVEEGFSNHPTIDHPTRLVPINWRGEITWDRVTGHVLSYDFTIDYDGAGYVTYASATLNQSTGVYSVVDNSATAPVPEWQTVASTFFAGGSASISVHEAGASFDYVIPDTGHGAGPVTQSLQITMTDRYDEGDVFEDAQAMLDLIDLSNIPTGDSTGTFVPLEPNTEYTLGYEAWPTEIVAMERTYYQESGLTFCVPNLVTRPIFPPVLSKLYGTKEQIFAAFYGDTSTFDTYHFPGRTMSDSYVPAEPQVSGFWYGYPGPSQDYFSIRWVFVSKVRISPDGERVCIATREQQQCICVPYDIVQGAECSESNWELTLVTDCDRIFYDPANPAGTCITGHATDLCLNPGDILFEYGVAILYQSCRVGDYPECPGLSIAPSCCN